MRAPDFWHRRQDGGLGALLAPLGWAWGRAAAVRRATVRPWRAPVAVLCVGNLVAGGAGKTPVALNLGARLAARGIDVHFLSRGYGGTAPGPLRVDAEAHGAEEVGDEALLLARCRPTWVARNRAAGARAAAAAGAELVVMDDGFQNPSLAKDLSLLVVDGAYGFGNRRVMPAGPLREPVAAGLARADAVVLVGDDKTGIDFADLPLLRARQVPGPEAARLAGKPVVAFAGIARPGKFFATLESIGCRLVGRHAFPDHHPYAASEIEDLVGQAAAVGALAVTTAKDAVRLPAESGAAIEVLTVDLEWEDTAQLDDILARLVPDGR